MTKNELELFDIICGSEEPEQSVLMAIRVFSAFVKQHEASRVLPPDGLEVSS